MSASNPEAPVDKVRLLAAFRARAEAELAAATEAQRATVQGATHEENKPENDKDTRAIEASYLARGQAARVAELRDCVAQLVALKPVPHSADGPVRVGSLVRLEDLDTERDELCFLLSPGAGGEVTLDGVNVKGVSARSPLGRALIGRRREESFELPLPQGRRELSIACFW